MKSYFIFDRANGQTHMFNALRIFLHYAAIPFVGHVGLDLKPKDMKDLLFGCIDPLSNVQEKKIYSSKKKSNKKSEFKIELVKRDDSGDCKTNMVDFLENYTEPDTPLEYVLN